jgi:hypothetical protein
MYNLREISYKEEKTTLRIAESTVTSQLPELSDYLYNTNACAIKGKGSYILVCLCHISKAYSNLFGTKILVYYCLSYTETRIWMFCLVEL